MTNNLTLITIILFIGNICLLQPVIGDKALIIELCVCTPGPDVCQQCLKNAIDDDGKELAKVAIDCATSLSEAVILDFDGIAKNSGDDAIKELCARCKQIIEHALSSIDQAAMDSGYGHFADAADQMKNSYFIYSDCSELAQKIPAPPVKFSDDFSTLLYNILNAHAILNKLSKGKC